MIHRNESLSIHYCSNFLERPRLSVSIPTHVQNLTVQILGLSLWEAVVRVTAQTPRAILHFVPYPDRIVKQTHELAIQDHVHVVTHVRHVLVLNGILFLIPNQLAIDGLLMWIVVIAPQSVDVLALDAIQICIELVHGRIQAEVAKEQQNVVRAHRIIDTLDHSVVMLLNRIEASCLPNKFTLMPKMEI